MNAIEFKEILMEIIEKSTKGLEPELNGVEEVYSDGHTSFCVKTDERTFTVEII